MNNNNNDLASKKCVLCEGGIPPLNRNEIKTYHKLLRQGWDVIDDKSIQKVFSFVNYKHTMDFVNRVAQLAEAEGHHPVMHVHFAKVEVELWTHAINGLSENDFILAAKIDLL